jgi:UV radiation resistance-associated gene protein
VRNLTPFPFRDEFAAALVQPSEQPQFTAHGHLSDDLDLTVSRKRGRKRSCTSVSSLSWHPSSEHDAQGVPESSGRKRALSRASTYSVGVTSTPKTKPSSSSVPARPLLRQRTVSAASSSSFAASSLYDSTIPASISLSGFLQDTSQDALEHIVHSRLVETFLTLTAAPSETPAQRIDADASAQGHLSNTVATGSRHDMKPRRRSTIASSAGIPISQPSTLSKGSLASISSQPPSLRAKASGHLKASSVSSPPAGKGSLKPSPSKPLSHRSSTPGSVAASKTPSSPFSVSTGSESQFEKPIPDYISPIHKPSTNPLFEIDTQGGFEFSPDTDLRATKVVVEIWGRLSQDIQDKRKGKERAHSFTIDNKGSSHEWQILKTWDVDLNKLEILSDDVGFFIFVVITVAYYYSIISSLLDIPLDSPLTRYVLHWNHLDGHTIYSLHDPQVRFSALLVHPLPRRAIIRTLNAMFVTLMSSHQSLIQMSPSYKIAICQGLICNMTQKQGRMQKRMQKREESHAIVDGNVPERPRPGSRS